jgi:hypothetical protein
MESPTEFKRKMEQKFPAFVLIGYTGAERTTAAKRSYSGHFSADWVTCATPPLPLSSRRDRALRNMQPWPDLPYGLSPRELGASQSSARSRFYCLDMPCARNVPKYADSSKTEQTEAAGISSVGPSFRPLTPAPTVVGLNPRLGRTRRPWPSSRLPDDSLIRTTTQPAPSRFDDTKRACSLSTGWGAHHHASPASPRSLRQARHISADHIERTTNDGTDPGEAMSAIGGPSALQANWKLETGTSYEQTTSP